MKKGRRVVVRYSSKYEKTLPTDLSDAEWNYIEPHMPAPNEHASRKCTLPPRDPKRHLLRSKKWLPVVAPTPS
jgi:hypothetical protein